MTVRVLIIFVSAMFGSSAWPTSLDASNARDSGFKTAHFFTGSASLNHGREWASQSHQDNLISSIFSGRDGFFVDIASNHAIRISNTFSLERNSGWEGICVEANPMYFWDLVKRKCTPVFAVVSNVSDEEVTFTLAAAFGGIDARGLHNGVKQGGKRHHTSSATFRTTTVDAIMRLTKAPRVIHYLSLDIEGAEYLALEHFPFDRHVFLTMTIERPERRLRQLLSANGYLYTWCLGYGDELWVHESLANNLHGLAADMRLPSKLDVINALRMLRMKLPTKCFNNSRDNDIRRFPTLATSRV